MQLTFLGAAGEVTGSQHLVETSRLRLLLDCGLFQGRRAEAYAKNARFFCDPKSLDGVVLSHGHIDHCGNLPRLYKQGFRGPVFCTPATADVAEIMLLDSAAIQQEDAKYLVSHLDPGAPPIEPLYDADDVRAITSRFETLDYGQWHDLGEGLRLKFSDAGHILGSAITEMDLLDEGQIRRVTFTGDLGRRDLPILRDPEPVESCDVLITESTYGNRLHPPADDVKGVLLRVFHEAAQRGGRVIIPAFSLGRTQTIAYFLNELHHADLLPAIPVFVDSPLSARLSEVYRRHQHIMDESAQRLLRLDDDLFGFPGLTPLRTQQESMALNRRSGPFAVIAASGMCEHGRVRHHLRHGLSDDRNTVLLIGFQAGGTLGRRLAEGATRVRLLGYDVPVRARIETLSGLSAHADVEDFRWWFRHLSEDGGIGHAFVVHGESESAQAVADLLRDDCNHDPIVPVWRQSFTV